MKKLKKTEVGTTQRGLRLPVTMDKWIVDKTADGNYRSPQEFILDVLRERQERDTRETVAA